MAGNRKKTGKLESPRIDRLRPSRDGDQFHYWWAARRSLALLRPGATLVAISVEGVPAEEAEDISDGVDVIDVAEYHGSKDIQLASSVRYYQLKHSTRRASTPCHAGDLSHTMSLFAARYKQLERKFGTKTVAERFSFEYLTNRPIGTAVQDALAILQAGRTDGKTAALAGAIGLAGKKLFAFARLLKLTGDADDYLEQRRLLDLEHIAYLPGRDEDAPIQLKEVVTRRATSEYQNRPEIERYDVLKALGVHEGELEPADCRIDRPNPFVARAAIAEIAQRIVGAAGPLIVTAEGGEGKSAMAIDLADKLPTGSVTFVYDCFGNGSYRSATGYRHRPADGLVQLGNEMAVSGLCAPLIPSPKADASAYVKAFMDRVRQAAAVLATRAPSSLLCLIVDAADNAETIAAELTDGPSFPRLLMRETWPANVRLVLLARGYRVPRLDPPPDVAVVPFGPFAEEETKANLIGRGINPTAAQLAEFHRLTSRNPRVQAAVIEEGGTLTQILARLGPTPLKVDDTIGIVLARAVEKVRDEWVQAADRESLQRICEALATLRPLVPIRIVAQIAGVPEGMVRSFVQDMGRGIMEDGDAVQFRDEPTETWFRDTFKPSAMRIGEFIERLKPLAPASPYVAASLPQLLLEANRFDELVQLALTGAALPTEPMARRDVEVHRLQFAIKAAIRGQRYSDACRLALKAANEAAAQGRQQRLIAANTDLAARFVDAAMLAEQVSRREIPRAGWTGSEHAYSAALLSAAAGLAGEASSQLRQSCAWLRQWLETPRERRAGQQGLEVCDIAEIAMAELNLNGYGACARSLRRWTRRAISFEAGTLLVSRLVDACRYNDIDALGRAAGNDLGLILAICVELHRVGRVTEHSTVQRAIRIALRPGLIITDCGGHAHDNLRLWAVTALAIAGARIGAAPDWALGRLIGRYIKLARRYFSPRQPAALDDRDRVMRAYAVRAALLGRSPTSAAIARLGLRSRERNNYEMGELHKEFDRTLPWHVLAAEVDLGRLKKRELSRRLQDAENASASSGFDSDTRAAIANAQAALRGHILIASGLSGPEWQRFTQWLERANKPPYVTNYAELARFAARKPGFEGSAAEFAATAFRLGTAEHDHAEQTSDMCVSLARATLPLGDYEARAYFDKAVEASEKIGDENIWRYEALLYIADIASSGAVEEPEIGYRLSRAGELTYALVARDKHFDYWHAIQNITQLSPRSGPAILSRWNDRRFGFHRDLLPDLLGTLQAGGNLDPLDALCLAPLDGAMADAEVLKTMLSASAHHATRREALRFVIDYLRFAACSSSTWMFLESAAEAAGIDVESIADERARALRREARLNIERQRPAKPKRRSASVARKLNACFAGLDVSVPSDLRLAASRMKTVVEFGWQSNLVDEAWARMKPGGEPGLFEGLATIEKFGSFELSKLFDLLPEGSDLRPSVRAALANLVRVVARRDKYAASVARSYKTFDWPRVTELCGVTLEEAIRLGAETLSATAIVPDAETLFILVSRWARLLTPTQAGDVLRFGLDLYEPLHAPGDGDGPWRPALVPPASVRAALAGYVWSALADPTAARRWEAAHAVRGLCHLGRKDMLAELIAIAEHGQSGPFGAPAHHFYALHGLQWLLIALARSAAESGSVVAEHAAFLQSQAAAGQEHVLIRSLAATALLELDRQSLVPLSAEERARLAELAAPSPQQFKDVPAAKRRRQPRKFDPADRSRFLIGLDFDKYWTVPLSSLLGVDQDEFETGIEQVIRRDWGLAFTGRWDEDARGLAGLFDDSRTYGQSMPDEDSLSHYLSYHALHVTAGRLLAAAEPGPDRQPGWDRRTYAHWFAEHRLTRSDGNWLFDRRDRVPRDLVEVPRPSGDWIGSQTEAELARQLEPIAGWIAVSADIDRYAGQDSEEITITSALVTSDRAKSLARALQVAEYYDQRLPVYQDSDDIDHGDYRLHGWVDRRDHERGLDGKDPWSGGLRASPFEPGEHYRAMLSLAPEDLARTWRRGSDEWLRSEFWSEGEDGKDVRFGRGARLLASRAAIEELLQASDSSLIVQVRVERERFNTRYERQEETTNRDSKLTRIFVVERDGRIWTPGRGYGARARARSRTVA